MTKVHAEMDRLNPKTLISMGVEELTAELARWNKHSAAWSRIENELLARKQGNNSGLMANNAVSDSYYKDGYSNIGLDE